jgi:hypothetical protein
MMPNGGAEPAKPVKLLTWSGPQNAAHSRGPAPVPRAPAPDVDPYDPYGNPRPVAAAPPAPLPFMPHAPPPLLGVHTVAASSFQEVNERLAWLEAAAAAAPAPAAVAEAEGRAAVAVAVAGAAEPAAVLRAAQVSLALATGEWGKAIRTLLQAGTK